MRKETLQQLMEAWDDCSSADILDVARISKQEVRNGIDENIPLEDQFLTLAYERALKREAETNNYSN